MEYSFLAAAPGRIGCKKSRGGEGPIRQVTLAHRVHNPRRQHAESGWLLVFGNCSKSSPAQVVTEGRSTGVSGWLHQFDETRLA